MMTSALPRRSRPAATRHVPLVLIVDDSERNLKLARDVLRAAGLRTLEATTGGEAIALAAEHLPDVILLDLRLPDMDGTDARERLVHARTARIPIVALSACGRRRATGAAAGFAGYLAEADRRPRVPGRGAPLLHGPIAC